MTGYTRNDGSDQIANGNIVDAAPLDGEFNALQTAFSAASGHSHNGDTGGGAPINTLGPSQEVTASNISLYPKVDNSISLGSLDYRWKDLFLGGDVDLNTVTIRGGTVNATKIGLTTPNEIKGTTITGTSFVGPLTGNAATATKLATPRTITLSGDVVGSGSFDGSSNITITTTGGGEGGGFGTIASQNANNVTITGGSITGITPLGIPNGGTGASTTLGLKNSLGLGTAADYNTSYFATAYQGMLAEAALLASSIASTPQATAGSVDTVYMTPLKTNQAITALAATSTQGAKADAALPAASKATQAQAEAGSVDTVYMTPQKTKQAIAALAVGSTDVNTIGAYCVCVMKVGETGVLYNQTVLGSKIWPAAFDGTASTTALSGSWRCMSAFILTGTPALMVRVL